MSAIHSQSITKIILSHDLLHSELVLVCEEEQTLFPTYWIKMQMTTLRQWSFGTWWLLRMTVRDSLTIIWQCTYIWMLLCLSQLELLSFPANEGQSKKSGNISVFWICRPNRVCVCVFMSVCVFMCVWEWGNDFHRTLLIPVFRFDQVVIHNISKESLINICFTSNLHSFGVGWIVWQSLFEVRSQNQCWLLF